MANGFFLFFLFLCFRFFIDIRLYNKARSAIEPFAFSRFREEKIRQQIEATRPARLKIKSNLPSVNQELALKYIDENENSNKKKPANLLKDDRFKALFTNPEFQVDKNADEYKMLTPVLSRLDKSKVKELKKKVETKMPYEDDEPAKSSDDDLFSEKDENEEMESSEDEDRAWEKDLKRNYREIRKEQKSKAKESDGDTDDDMDSDNGNEHQHSTSAAPKLEFKVKNITNKLSR